MAKIIAHGTDARNKLLAGILLHAENADVSTAAATAFDDVAMVGRKASRQHIVDLRRSTAKIFSQLIAF